MDRHDSSGEDVPETSPLPSAVLLVIQGENQGGRYSLPPQPELTIGRGLGVDIRILDTEVSRRHALLGYRDRSWVLQDAGSSNGTFVNGRAVQDVVTLREGDQIQVGRTVLLFSSGLHELSDASHRVDLVGGTTEDRSEIVSEVGRDAGSDLVRRAASELHREDPFLRLLYQVTEEAVRPTLSLNERLQRILDLTVSGLRAHRGCMFVTDLKTDRILPRVVSRPGESGVGEKMPISRTIVEYVVTRGQGVRTSDARHDKRFEAGQSIMRSGIREAMCVPMQGRYELLGAIYVDTTSQGHPLELLQERFSDDQLALLAAIGRQSALAVENDRYQQALVAAERLAAVGQTIATLSHHVKNILQGIRGGSYLIDTGLEHNDQPLIRKGWQIVERNQDRIYNLVVDMLTLGKERTPDYQPGNVNDVVREVVELLQSRADEAGIEFVLHLDDDLPVTLFDAEGIHRCILNLILNSMDALHEAERGTITMTTSVDDEAHMVLLEVADDGPGIPPEEMPNIFQLFHSSKGARGTGLGLPVSKKIVEEHGGELSVRSQPGAGATFSIRIPISEGDAPESFAAIN